MRPNNPPEPPRRARDIPSPPSKTWGLPPEAIAEARRTRALELAIQVMQSGATNPRDDITPKRIIELADTFDDWINEATIPE